jgi:hypothetical protein
MQIESNYKLEKAVATTDRCRPSIENVLICKDGKHPVAVATNGRIMAVVPVEIDDDRELGLVSPEALKRARKAGVSLRCPPTIILNGDARFLDGSSLPRPDQADCGQYPKWEQIAKMEDERKPAFTVSLDPKLLLDLAEAVGWEKGHAVTLAVSDSVSAIVVTTAHSKGRGYLMPRRDGQ